MGALAGAGDREGRGVKAEVDVSPKILALHNGKCSECNAAIRKGESIQEVVATGKYVHPECVPVVEVRF